MMIREELFRPSSLARYKTCPGALALESTLPPQDRSGDDAEEGRMLHAYFYDPSKPRSDLTAEQLDVVTRAEEMQEEFERMIK